MKIKKAKYLILFVLLLPFDLYSQWAIMREDADSLVIEGTHYIYNVKFEEAEKAFKKVIKLYPDHPVGYFLDAMVFWWKTKLYTNQNKYDKPFIDKITRVVEISDELLKKNSKDINALFFKAGALGYRGRFYAEKESWLKAASDGAEAFNLLQECRKIAPHNHDIMLGTGIYNYFAKVIPERYPITKPMLTFLPKGDKSLGIYQLKAAANHARYSGVEALVVLLQIHYSFEQDVEKALEYATTLNGMYPDNPYFHRYLGRTNVRAGNYAEIESVWREVVIRCMNKMPGYDIGTAREATYYVGNSLYRKKDYDMALKYFKKSIEASEIIDQDEESGFHINAIMYSANIYDKLGDKDKAKKLYKSVLEMREYDSSHKKAQSYLKNN